MTQDTNTSGAADLPEALRSIQRFEVVDCIDDKHVPAVIPKPHGPWVRYEDHIAALAAGQATAAQAEPDPTPGDHPQPCDSELFESGVSVGLFDIPKWTAEALCKGIAAATGARVDWHYIGGRVHVKALPAPTSAEGVAYAALVCDYCGALTPDPWHSSGMLHGKMSKHIHSCDACAARGAAKAQAAKQQEQLI